MLTYFKVECNNKPIPLSGCRAITISNRRSRNTLKMKSIVVLFLFVHLYEVAGTINMGSDDRRHALQVSSAACTLHIARKHFLSGTTTAIVQSGLPSTVHFNSAQSSYFLMLTAFMTELNWTVVINQADTFISEVYFSR